MKNENTKPRKAFGYARVSTWHQAENGHSLESQERAIRRWCEYAEVEFAGMYSDVESGRSTKKRPGLESALKSTIAENGILVAFEQTRLSRSAIDSLNILHALHSGGADLVLVDQGIDTRSAMGELVFTWFAGFGQYQRREIIGRTKAGLARKRERGEKLGGSVPFGYNVERRNGKKYLVENPTETAVIRAAVEMRKSGLTLAQIANNLNSNGISSKQGGKWSPAKVWRIAK